MADKKEDDDEMVEIYNAKTGKAEKYPAVPGIFTTVLEEVKLNPKQKHDLDNAREKHKQMKNPKPGKMSYP